MDFIDLSIQEVKTAARFFCDMMSGLKLMTEYLPVKIEDLPTTDSIKKLESAAKKRLATPKAKRNNG